MDREKFDDIYQQLSFGAKPKRNVDQVVEGENKLLLRRLPKEDPPVKKRRKLSSDKENSGIKLFSDSAITLEAAAQDDQDKPVGLTTEERVAQIRQLNQIYTWGAEIPDPFINFKDLGLSKQLLTNIKDAGFREPTPIQMQAVPILLNRQNLLANAPTGSGKTLAFVLPILKLMLDKPNNKARVNAVILSPTNVLAQQIYVQFLKFAENLPVRIMLLEPGVPIEDADILVATPYKFIYSLKKENLTAQDLSSLRWLILDEADRLFETTEGDRNFRLQFEEVCKACKGPKTRLAFFSATFSFELENWCKKELEDPAMICIGHRNSANSDVKQELMFTGDESGKLFALRQLLSQGFEPPALVFVQSKERAGTLLVELQTRCPDVPVRLISSELTNEARDKILNKFRSGKVWVLIATEMLGRGLDICNLNLVINFDLPMSVISYIHRVGRTGRAGHKGRAVTFFTRNDMGFIRPIATVIKQAGFEVPEYTLNLEKVTKKQRKWLRKHAPKRENVGSVGRWNRVKKLGMKDRVIKHDPVILHNNHESAGSKNSVKSNTVEPKIKPVKKQSVKKGNKIETKPVKKQSVGTKKKKHSKTG